MEHCTPADDCNSLALTSTFDGDSALSSAVPVVTEHFSFIEPEAGTLTCIFVADAQVGTEFSFGHSEPSHLIEIAVGTPFVQLKNKLLD